MSFLVERLASTTSTNDWILERWEDLAHHSVCLADIQTAGRGRLGRTWESEGRGNLYLSILEKNIPESLRTSGRIPNFTQLMAVSAATVCRYFSVPVKIKWPNDIITDDGKLGGILAQARFKGNVCSAVVVGIGLNIAEAPELPPESLYRAAHVQSYTPGNGPSRDLFTTLLLTEYEYRWNSFLAQGFSSIRDEFAVLLHTGDGTMEVSSGVEGEPTVRGAYEGLGDKGELLLRGDDGQLHRMFSGEIT